MTELEKIQELQRISLPDEIWDYIKEFIFDWKETHRRKFSDCRCFTIGKLFSRTRLLDNEI